MTHGPPTAYLALFPLARASCLRSCWEGPYPPRSDTYNLAHILLIWSCLAQHPRLPLLTYCPTPACLSALFALLACLLACLPCLQWGIPEGRVVSAPCEDLLRRLIVLVSGGREGRVGLTGRPVGSHPVCRPAGGRQREGTRAEKAALKQDRGGRWVGMEMLTHDIDPGRGYTERTPGYALKTAC